LLKTHSVIANYSAKNGHASYVRAALSARGRIRILRAGLNHRRLDMKKYLLATVLAALAASPAFAANSHRAMHNDSATGAFASVPQSGAVVQDGKIIGADPDSSIRLQLLREGDHTGQNGGN
jgi:hypothetical protein